MLYTSYCFTTNIVPTQHANTYLVQFDFKRVVKSELIIIGEQFENKIYILLNPMSRNPWTIFSTNF